VSRRAAAALAALLTASVAGAPAGGASLPDWLTAAQRATPPALGRASALVLHDEEIVEVPARGRSVTTTRWAVRILTRDALDAAEASAGYARGSSEVKSFKAWTLAADGSVLRKWDRKQAADVSDLEGGQLYTDLRHLMIRDDEIQVGQTFAWESVQEEEPLFAQWRWWFRGEYPCALSRFELRLPAGLDVRVRSVHLEGAETRASAGTWSWQMRDVPARPNEPLASRRPDLGPYLCVDAVSATGDRSAAGITFRDWPTVSRWVGDLAATQSEMSPGIRSTAAALSGSAADSLARIRAIAEYVQRLNYVAIELNIGRGWGYRPTSADAVLRAGYGDCKDKANLLCTLLRAAGHESWLLPVYWGSRDRVDSAWASPGQFNHCIVGIRIPASYRGPVIEAASGERLLAFDPTDPLTTFGDLPREQQGSWALLVSPGSGGLVRLPMQPADRYRLERRVDATLSPAGRLDARVVERSNGQTARDERAFRRESSRAQYQSALEARLPAQGGNVAIRSWETREDSAGGRYELRIEFDSPTFARNVGDRVLTFRSALLSPRLSWSPTDTARVTPIALPAVSVRETLTVRLPEGFALDEHPTDLHAANDLGQLDATWQVADGALVMTRRWELRPATVGPERWPDVRALYAARRASNEATVVLVRR
jgi:transglutaminase-like putative cysteine protease